MPAATFAPAWLDPSPEKLGGCVQSPPPPLNSYYITNSYYINHKNNDKEDEINIYNDVNNLGDNSGNKNDEN